MEIIKVAHNFWNIRGTFKIGGLVDTGTQATRVKLHNGDFIFLGACRLSSSIQSKINRLTHGGSLIKAIVNLHPFHSVNVQYLHALYPGSTHTAPLLERDNTGATIHEKLLKALHNVRWLLTAHRLRYGNE